MIVLGIVRLAPGQVGYFDDLTRIHLTIAAPEKPVLKGMNTTNLKRAVKSGRLMLINGSLDEETAAVEETQVPIVMATEQPVEPIVEPVVEETQAPVETVEEPVVEETAEAIEEIVESETVKDSEAAEESEEEASEETEEGKGKRGKKAKA